MVLGGERLQFIAATVRSGRSDCGGEIEKLRGTKEENKRELEI